MLVSWTILSDLWTEQKTTTTENVRRELRNNEEEKNEKNEK